MVLKKFNGMKVSVFAVVLSVGMLTSYSMTNKKVTLVVNGQETKVSTLRGNVKGVLDEKKVNYNKNDIINVGLNHDVVNGEKIEVTKVSEKTIKEYKVIPFDTKVITNEKCNKGKMEVVNEGQNGQNELVYKLTYHNDKLVNKELVKETVEKKAETRILKELPDSNENKNAIVKGHSHKKVAVKKTSCKDSNSVKKNVKNSKTASSSKSGVNLSGKNMKVVATAYSGDSITAMGTKPKWGTIAVDPRVIPYGTKVYIPQFNMVFTAEDCGGAIKGKRIDIFMADSSKVDDWGVKSIDINIVK